MSSGEKAKPPATFEERNPFDISRRSGPEVAAEIAKRMAAWKQARTRTTRAAPTTIPSGTTPSGTTPSGEVKPPPIAAPVQPARMPKSTGPATQSPSDAASGAATPSVRKAAGTAPGVPYFASASATRRAMPPAPSLKSATRQPKSDESAVRADEPESPVGTPLPEQLSNHQVPPAAPDVVSQAAGMPGDAAPITADPALVQPGPSSIEAHPFESPAIAATSAPAEPDDSERRRAEAQAIKARWIAAHDLDARDFDVLADAARSSDTAAVAARETGNGGDLDRSADAHQAVAGIDSPPTDQAVDDGAAFDEPTQPEAHTVESAATFETAPAGLDAAVETIAEARALDVAALDEMAGRREPTFDARARSLEALDESSGEPPVTAPEPDPATAEREPDHGGGLSLAALDEVAGRKEPTFDQPVQHEAAAPAPVDDGASGETHSLKIETLDEVGEGLRTPAIAGEPPAHRDAADEGSGLNIAALDDAAGRKEPTFDEPVRREASASVPATPIDRAPVTEAGDREAPKEAARRPRFDRPIEIDREAAHARGFGIAHRAEATKEPSVEAPVRPVSTTSAESAAKKAAPRIALRPIETRIEARRVDTLRADPQLAVHRPIFPHIEPEEWDVPPVVAARARRERRGTGWAIGLGSVLLVAGITAPAALWQQQGRQVQDQVALVTPAPATQQSTTSVTTAPAPAQPPAQAMLPTAPQEAPPPAPAADTPESATPSVMAAAPSAKPDAAQPTVPAAALGAIDDGGDVNESPVIAPPSPMVNLASKTDSAGTGSPMVARPFIPEQGDGPFLRPPTSGAASVAVDTPQPGAQPVGSGVKPNLMGLLKPKAAAVASASKPVTSKPQAVVRKPKPFFQQSPEQMFDTLIDTLSEGRPVNPATKPTAPSNRR